MESVSGEEWYMVMRKYLDSSKDIIGDDQQVTHRPFVGFLRDSGSGAIESLTFDKNVYARGKGTEVSGIFF